MKEEEFFRLVKEERFEEAKAILETMHPLATYDSFYYGNMGWVLNQLERYDEAKYYLFLGIKHFPNEGYLYCQLGYSFIRLDDIEEGLQYLLEGLSKGYDLTWVHGEIGWCYIQLSNYEEAINYLENALFDEPDHPYYLLLLGDSYRMNGQLYRALEAYLKSSKMQMDYDICIAISKCYMELKNYDKSLEWLNKAKSYTHYLSEIVFLMGKNYYFLEKYDNALKYIEQSIKMGYKNADSYILYGDLAHLKGYEKKGNVLYRKAIDCIDAEIDEYQFPMYYHKLKVRLLYHLNDYNTILDVLSKLSKKYLDETWINYAFANIYTILGQYEDALPYFSKCLNDYQNHQEFMDLYGYTLGKVGYYQKAIDLFLMQLDEFGEDLKAYKNIAWNYIQLEEYEQALEYCEKAYALDIEDKNIQDMIRICYENIELKNM